MTVENGMITVTQGWTAEKTYSINYGKDNRLINGMYGAQVPFIDFDTGDSQIVNHYLGTVTKEFYDTVAHSISTPDQLAFWMPDNTLRVRRIKVNFGANTYLDSSRSAIVGIGNTVTLIPTVEDDQGNVWNDVTQVEVKNLQKQAFPMNINGNPTEQYKVLTTNGGSVTINMLDSGRTTIRFKAKIPEIDTIWLSVYPELYSYNPENLAKFEAWAAANPT